MTSKAGTATDALLRRLKERCEQQTPKRIREAAERQRRVMHRSRVLSSDMPTEYRDLLLDLEDVDGVPFRDTEAMSLLGNALADPRKRTIVLAGPTRTGKSTAAAWWCAESGARWVLSTAFLRSKHWEPVSRVAFTADCIVLDDVGISHESERDSAAIEALIWERHSNTERRTVVTTNLKPEQFKDRYKVRIYNRILERGEILLCKTKESAQ